MMEKCIERRPAYWLWTHKRWKYTRKDSLVPVVDSKILENHAS